LEIFVFYLDDENVFKKVTNKIKDEESFREEEKIYNQWRKNKEEGSDISTYKFAPSWYEFEDISLKDLSSGDIVEVIYYRNKDKNKAVKVLVESRKDEPIFNEDQNKSFRARVNVGVVKDNSIIFDRPDNFDFIEDDKIEATITESTEIIQKSIKSEEQFRQEETEYQEKKENLKNLGKDISSLEAPSWFLEEKVSLFNLKEGDFVDVLISVIDNDVFVKKIEKIIK